MQKEKEKTIYCSLDIETSGFDPESCEVLEVGLAFFTVGRSGVKIATEWTRVFRPVKEVPPNILGLTGITKEELQQALPFSQSRDELQEKLRDAVIVGHNIIFDTRFLESFGIEFSGRTIDTLDLAQFILPTHHSYNLENLMHVFGIPHQDAHRALADAKAALRVLERMLQIYSGYPKKLREAVIKLAGPHNPPWLEFLNIGLKPAVFNPPQNASLPTLDLRPLPALRGGHIYSMPLGQDYAWFMLEALLKGTKKALLAVPTEGEVYKLWKRSGIKAVFPGQLYFDPEKFRAFLDRPNLSFDELKFALKILVWQETNWQQECLLDLNLSFFGGQYKEQVSGKEPAGSAKDRVLCLSHKTLCEIAENKLYSDRLVAVKGLAEFEKQLSLGQTSKASWGHIVYLLKSYYNPELDTGNKELKAQVTELLNATDLFFGLVNALFQTTPPSFQYVRVTAELAYSQKFQNIRKAGEAYITKLKQFGDSVSSYQLAQSAGHLSRFFEEDRSGQVKWLELADNRCGFYSSPLGVDYLMEKLRSSFPKILFADSLGSGKVQSYFVKRLGLSDFKQETMESRGKISAPSLVQGELFAASPAAILPGKIRLHLEAKTASSEEILKAAAADRLPAAVLFGTGSQVKLFYEANYQILGDYARLLTHLSGGSNKMLHNFAIHKNSLILATDKFILRALDNSDGPQSIASLPVKTLILCHLPFEQFSHPYQEALSTQFENPFEDYTLPRAVYNFHRIINFFSTPALRDVYIMDSKLSKSYFRSFREYVMALPGVYAEEVAA